MYKKNEIAVIVPVYNVEKYLPRCIDSILRQTYPEFKIILVDDGSTDASGMICDEYSNRNPLIKVVHKENGGLSSARNAGLDVAESEYVYFVDSDDEIFDNTLEILFQRMTDGIDMVTGGYFKCNEKGECLYDVPQHFERDLSIGEFALLLSKPFCYESNAIACIHLMRLEIINNHHLRFDEKIRFCEDTPFVAQYICNCSGKIHLTTLPIYKYYFRSTSLVGSAYAVYKESTYDILLSKLYVYATLKSASLSKKVLRAAAVKAYYTYIDMINYSLQFDKKNKCRDVSAMMNKYFSHRQMFILKCRDMIRRFIKR